MLYPELDDIIRYSADESLLMALVKRVAKALHGLVNAAVSGYRLVA